MITTSVINLVLGLLSPLVAKLPDISFGFLSGETASTFLEWIKLAGYMLPFNTFFQIFGIICALQCVRILIGFFKALWGVLPVV